MVQHCHSFAASTGAHIPRQQVRPTGARIAALASASAGAV